MSRWGSRKRICEESVENADKGAIWKNAVISIAVILVIYFVFKNFLNVPIDFGMFSI